MYSHFPDIFSTDSTESPLSTHLSLFHTHSISNVFTTPHTIQSIPVQPFLYSSQYCLSPSQPTHTIGTPIHIKSSVYRTHSPFSHLDGFPSQKSLAHTLPTLLCSRFPSPLFLVSFVTSYAFQSHCLNTHTTITIPFQSLLQHISFR